MKYEQNRREVYNHQPSITIQCQQILSRWSLGEKDFLSWLFIKIFVQQKLDCNIIYKFWTLYMKHDTVVMYHTNNWQIPVFQNVSRDLVVKRTLCKWKQKYELLL